MPLAVPGWSCMGGRLADGRALALPRLWIVDKAGGCDRPAAKHPADVNTFSALGITTHAQRIINPWCRGRAVGAHSERMLEMAVRVIMPPLVVSSISSAAAPSPNPTWAPPDEALFLKTLKPLLGAPTPQHAPGHTHCPCRQWVQTVLLGYPIEVGAMTSPPCTLQWLRVRLFC